VRLRAEAEAPWRSLRLTLSGFSVASAGMGSLICLPQLIGALGGAPGALPLRQVFENLGIDLGAVGLFAFLFSRDWQVCAECCGCGCVCGGVVTGVVRHSPPPHLSRRPTTPPAPPRPIPGA
jgi:hypothetical protein